MARSRKICVGAPDALITAVAHFEASNRKKTAHADTAGRHTFWFPVLSAAAGVRVTVDVRVVAHGQKRSTRVWFAPRQPPPPPAPPAVAFGCNVLQTGGGQEEFNVTTTGGGTYSGPVNVSFYDYPGSGHIFPPTTVQGATPAGSWQPVPAADIGASAERPLGALAGGQVDGPGSTRRQRDGDDLAALTGDGQRPVAALHAEGLNVGAGGSRRAPDVS